MDTAGAERGRAGAPALLALIIGLIIIIVVLVAASGRRLPRGGGSLFASGGASAAPAAAPTGCRGVPGAASRAAAISGEDAPERRSVHAALSRLYSTADADPLVTGQLYQFSDGVRSVYGQRTSHGDVYGLSEYNSSGAPGDVGVDLGPWGLDEYGGKIVGFDDGLPEAWALPSTPMRWYGPKQRDYYGVEGPTVYAEGLYTLSEPDHDPLVN